MMLRVLTLIALGVLATACSAPGKTVGPASLEQSASPVPANAAVMQVRYTGGMCPYGACETLLTVNRDGSFSRTSGKGPAQTGVLDTAKVAALSTEIARADFARIKSVPFTGTCPTAYDGQELIYTFHTASGPEEIASCKVQVDADSALFKAVQAVLDNATAH